MHVLVGSISAGSHLLRLHQTRISFSEVFILNRFLINSAFTKTDAFLKEQAITWRLLKMILISFFLYQTRTLKFDRLKSSRQSATVLLGTVFVIIISSCKTRQHTRQKMCEYNNSLLKGRRSRSAKNVEYQILTMNALLRREKKSINHRNVEISD